MSPPVGGIDLTHGPFRKFGFRVYIKVYRIRMDLPQGLAEGYQ